MIGSLQSAFRNMLEQTKQYIWSILLTWRTVQFGEVVGIDPDNHLVQCTMVPTSPYLAGVDNGSVVGMWLPLLVPALGVRGLPKVGDQCAILYDQNVPVAVIGFTYNVVDTPEATVASQQFRVTQKTVNATADLLVDGTTGDVTVNGGTHGVARVGDAVSVTGTATLAGTDPQGGTVTVSGAVTLVGTITAGSPNLFN